jgi:hypothetical protein
MEFDTVTDPMTQVLTFMAGQANASYATSSTAGAESMNAGYPLPMAPENFDAFSFASKNLIQGGQCGVRSYRV